MTFHTKKAQIDVKGYKVDVKDTTGAGDAYASGFFYGLTLGYSLEICGKIAALVSGKVVEVMGPNLPDEQWDEVKVEIEKIVQG